MEDGIVTISRALMSLTYPSRFTLLSAMNPCPCGYYTHPKKHCTCSIQQREKYISKISGPLLDRIDIHVEVPVVEYNELVSTQEAEPSAAIRERVNSARRLQDGRFKGSRTYFNAHMGPRHLRRHCQLENASQALLKNAVERFSLSARAYDRILKVARTIADLDGSVTIRAKHISESIQYRTLDRDYWKVGV